MLNIETKVDSAEKLAAVAGKPTENYLFATEFNQIVNKVKELEQPSIVTELSEKELIVDEDLFRVVDSEDENRFKKLTFLKLKTVIKSYFDSIYTTTSAVATQISSAISGKLDKSTTPDSVYATDVAGSQVMKPITDFISPTQLLEDFYNKSAKAIIEWVPYISIWGNAIAPGATGTADNVAPLWTGTYFQAQFRRRYASAVTAGSSTSFRDGNFRHTAIGEGFVSIQIFGNEDASNVAQARSACALIGGNGEIGNVNPSTVTKFIGVANDSGQANLHFNVSNALSLNHNIDLGSSFPANTNSTDFYLLIMINDKGVSNLKWRVVNLHSGADTGYSTITTGLPASTMGLAPQFWRNNGSTALAVKNSIMLYRLLKM